MNTNEKISKNTPPPQEFFQGKDLIMGKAIAESNITEIERLITRENYDVNARGHVTSHGRVQQFTYLNYAVLIRNVKSAEKLLQLNADVNLIALDGGGQLGNMNIASGGKNRSLMELLLKYKVNLNNPLAESPVNPLLIGDSDKSLITLLIKNGADLNHQNYIDGSTPLFTALSIGKFEYVNYFLDQGANPLLLDSSGNSVAYLVQKEIEEGSLSDSGLKEYSKLLNRFKNELRIQFPLNRNNRKSLEQSISRYENLTKEEKDLLGSEELERIDKYRNLLTKGVDLIGRPLD